MKEPNTLVIANREDDQPGGTGGNYVAKLQKLYRDGVLKAGQVVPMTVSHDSWCAIYDKKPCNCDPDIVLG